MKNYLSYAVAIGCSLAVGTILHAQDVDEAIDSIPQNAFFAPFEVIEDHPECSDAGETAYRLKLDADNVAFPAGTSDALVANNQVISAPATEPRVCYHYERRGTDRTQIRVPCDGGSYNRDLGRIEKLFGGATPQLKISAQVTTCLSIENFQVLDGSWEAEYMFDGQSFKYEGLVVVEDSAAIMSNNMQASISYTPQGRTLSYETPHYSIVARVDPEDAHLFIAETSLLHLRLQCLPVPTVLPEGTRTTTGAILAFVPVGKDMICHGNECDAPSLPNRVARPQHEWGCN